MKISLLCQILSSLHLWHNWLRPSLQFIMRTKKDKFWPPLRPPADLQDGRGWGHLLPQLKDAAVAVKKIIIYLNWVFNTYTPKADQKNFRWYLKDSHRFSASMAPLTPDLFLSCCISREKVFRGNGVTFREAGGRVRLCKLPSDAIATLQPHLSRKYDREEEKMPGKKIAREEKNAQGDKNCPRQKMSEKKNYQEMMLPLQPHLSRKYQNTGTFHPKGGISLQSAPKEEVRIRYLIFVISYTNTIMSKLFFWVPNIFILWLPNMPHFWEELLCWKQIQFNNINTVKLTLDGCQFCRWWGTAKFFY